MKTLKEILTAQKANLLAQQEALTKLLAGLPETLRAGLDDFSRALAEQLAKVPDLEKAVEMDAVQFLSGLVTELNAQHERVLGALAGFSAVQTELNTLKGQMASGEWLPKAKAEEAVALARADERKALTAEIAAARKGVLETAGLPVPVAAILELPAADFAERQKQATANQASIAKRTADTAAQKVLTLRYAWLSQSEFDGEMQTVDALLGAGRAGKAADPTLGAPGAPGQPATPAPTKLGLV